MYMSIWCSYLLDHIHVTWVTPSSWSNCPSSSSLNTPSLLPNPEKPPYWEEVSLIQHCLEGDRWNSSGGCPISTGWEVPASNPTLLLAALPFSSPVTCLKDFFWNTGKCLNVSLCRKKKKPNTLQWATYLSAINANCILNKVGFNTGLNYEPLWRKIPTDTCLSNVNKF